MWVDVSVPSVAGFPELIQASGISIPARAKFVTWCGQFAPLISRPFLNDLLQIILWCCKKLSRTMQDWHGITVRWAAFWVPQPLEPSPLVWFADNLEYCPLDVSRQSSKKPRILMHPAGARIHDWSWLIVIDVEVTFQCISSCSIPAEAIRFLFIATLAQTRRPGRHGGRQEVGHCFGVPYLLFLETDRFWGGQLWQDTYSISNWLIGHQVDLDSSLLKHISPN